jgi:hypothetical protein
MEHEEAESEQSSVIAAFIRRFREEPPTAPDHRAAHQDKEAFWWISKGKSVGPSGRAGGGGGVSPGAQGPEDNAHDKDSTANNSDRSRDCGLARSATFTFEEPEPPSPMDISEGEVPREDIPVRAPAAPDADAAVSVSVSVSAPVSAPVSVSVPDIDIARENRGSTRHTAREAVAPAVAQRPAASPRAPFGAQEDPPPPPRDPTAMSHRQRSQDRKEDTPSGPTPAPAPAPAVYDWESLLDVQKQEEDFEFNFGMEELDARTDMLLQKCDAVLDNFKPKTPPSPPASKEPPVKADAIGSNYKPNYMNRESFKTARDIAIAEDTSPFADAMPSSPQKVSSPVRGVQAGNESIFSLTSVLSEEEEKFLETEKLEKRKANSIQMSPHPDPTIIEKYPSEDRGRQLHPAGAAEEKELSPKQNAEGTPPRKHKSSNSKRRHRHHLASPESVRSINGISIDNSGLFMFLSSSEDGGSGHSSEGEEEEAGRRAPPGPADSEYEHELSRSSASYSEDYHRLMSSLQGVEMLGARDSAESKSNSKHPYALMRASKEYLKESKSARGGASSKDMSKDMRVPFVLNAETLSPYLEDEIVSVLWKQLVAVRSELRRRTEEE